ncbi:MAG: heme o synthase [Acidimicrobiales bacterium]
MAQITHVPARAGTPAGNATIAQRIQGFVALTKPRIIELLLVTTVPTMFVARRGIPSGWLVLATLVGGTLSAGGANAVNMYIDRDIDAVMKRTSRRPLVTGVVRPTEALVFAIGLQVAAFAAFALFVNYYSGFLALGAALFYVFVYTLGLKRRSKQNIVIGGAAGAVPVLIGWTAVTDHLAWPAVVLFALIVIWTPSHFWALAVKYREDYERAEVPMLPVVESFAKVANQIIWYSVALIATSFVFGVVAHMGWVYWAVAVVAGALYLVDAFRLKADGGTPKAAMRLFGYSITYVTALFMAMGVDVLVRYSLH